MAFPSSGKAFGSSKCGYPDITRNWLYDSGLKMRYRTRFNGDGYGVHPSVTSFTMHAETHRQAGRVIRDLATLGRDFPPDEREWRYRWTGVAGAKVCKPGYHRYGAAIDFTKFVWGPDQWVDMAVHGKDSRRRLRRRYLAVIATCRKHFGTVLHCYNDPDGSHWNHVHVDRGRTAKPFNWKYGTDVTIVQWAAKDLAGFSEMAIDGDWGPQSREGLARLRDRFKAGGVDPTESSVNSRAWLDLIAKHAMADQNAGKYTMD